MYQHRWKFFHTLYWIHCPLATQSNPLANRSSTTEWARKSGRCRQPTCTCIYLFIPLLVRPPESASQCHANLLRPGVIPARNELSNSVVSSRFNCFPQCPKYRINPFPRHPAFVDILGGTHHSWEITAIVPNSLFKYTFADPLPKWVNPPARASPFTRKPISAHE